MLFLVIFNMVVFIVFWFVFIFRVCLIVRVEMLEIGVCCFLWGVFIVFGVFFIGFCVWGLCLVFFLRCGVVGCGLCLRCGVFFFLLVVAAVLCFFVCCLVCCVWICVFVFLSCLWVCFICCLFSLLYGLLLRLICVVLGLIL